LANTRKRLQSNGHRPGARSRPGNVPRAVYPGGGNLRRGRIFRQCFVSQTGRTPAAVFESRTRMQPGSDSKSTSDHFSVSDYKKGWQKAARDAGIPDRRAYDLRASFASRANACHASGLTIAQLLGHANSTQILPTYVKPLDENIRAVINALDSARASRTDPPGSIQ